VSERAPLLAQSSVLQFVVDVSGSMSNAAPGGGTRWEVTRQALSSAIDSLPASTAVGILYYPNQPTTPSVPDGAATDPPRPVTDCVDTDARVPIIVLGAASSANRATIARSLAAAQPIGSTPTHDAYLVALDAIRATPFAGNRSMVLITDGQPTFLSGCRGSGATADPVDPRPIIDEVTTTRATGIQTFVIGSPGSEQVGVPVFADARTWLSMAASQGGTAQPGCSDTGPAFCHFDMTLQPDFAQALRRALDRIVGTIASCNYELPSPTGTALDRTRVNVIVTLPGGPSRLIPHAPDDNCVVGATGWRFSVDGSGLQLCSATCTELQATTNPTLEVLFGCATRQTP
jgi:hypothetical protein